MTLNNPLYIPWPFAREYVHAIKKGDTTRQEEIETKHRSELAPYLALYITQLRAAHQKLLDTPQVVICETNSTGSNAELAKLRQIKHAHEKCFDIIDDLHNQLLEAKRQLNKQKAARSETRR